MWKRQTSGYGIVFGIAVTVLFCFNIDQTQYYETDQELVIDEPVQSLAPRRLYLSPSSCNASNFVIMVHIRVDALDRRNEWRYTYGSFQKNLNFSLFFALGYPKISSFYPSLVEEQKKYGDLILADFIDDYRNMTLKHLAQLRFFHENCSSTRFLVKLDDDVAVNMSKLSAFISSIHDGPIPWFGMDKSYGPKLWCWVWENTVVRRSVKLKWAVPRSRWQKRTWPNYCAGLGYIATQSAVARVLKAAEQEQWLWVDDIFITGILTERGQVQLINANIHYSFDEWTILPFSWGKVMFTLTNRNETWKMFDIVN